ncbi:MAG: hypothetical protein ACOC2H_09145 [Spirochaetota bacterium]
MKVKDQVRINKRFAGRDMTHNEYALYMIWKVYYAIKPRFIFRPWLFLYSFIMNCDIRDITEAFYVVEAYEKGIPVAECKRMMEEDRRTTIEALKKKMEVRAEMVLGQIEEAKRIIMRSHKRSGDSPKLQ